MDPFLTLANARDDTMAALGLYKEVEKRNSGDIENDVEELWDVSDLLHSNECSLSALERMKSLWKSFSLPVPITVLELQQLTEKAFRAFLIVPDSRHR